MKLPPRLHSLKWISAGATGAVYRVNDHTVVKCTWTTDSDAFTRERRFYDVLEHHPPCPALIRSFMNLPQGIFLSYVGGGTLEQRLTPRQIRNDRKVTAVTEIEPPHIIKKWTIQLSNATAWVESLGFGHCDLEPHNLLLNDELDLKLCDFDWATEIGTLQKAAAFHTLD